MKSFAYSFCCAAIMINMATAGALAETYKQMVITAATANPPGSMPAITIDMYKEIVEKESYNTINVKTFYGGAILASGHPTLHAGETAAYGLKYPYLASGRLLP